MGVKNPWEPVQTYSNTQTPRLRRDEMGACASCGGVFNNYAIVQGVDKIVPVDVFIPGCPPTPDMLLFGFNELQRKIREGIPNPPDPLKASGIKLVGPIGDEL